MLSFPEMIISEREIKNDSTFGCDRPRNNLNVVRLGSATVINGPDLIMARGSRLFSGLLDLMLSNDD